MWELEYAGVGVCGSWSGSMGVCTWEYGSVHMGVWVWEYAHAGCMRLWERSHLEGAGIWHLLQKVNYGHYDIVMLTKINAISFFYSVTDNYFLYKLAINSLTGPIIAKLWPFKAISMHFCWSG